MVDLRAQAPGASTLAALRTHEKLQGYHTPLRAALGFSQVSQEGRVLLEKYSTAVAAAHVLVPLEARGWTVLHDVLLYSSGDRADHLLVAPSGALFSVTVHRHSERTAWVSDFAYRVAGKNVEYLRGGIEQARRVEKLTGRKTTPVLLLLGTRALSDGRKSSKDVLVATETTILSELEAVATYLPLQGSLGALYEESAWPTPTKELTVSPGDNEKWLRKVKASQKVAHSLSWVYTLGVGAVIVFAAVTFIISYSQQVRS